MNAKLRYADYLEHIIEAIGLVFRRSGYARRGGPSPPYGKMTRLYEL
jgi:hypothetical protein